MSIETCGRALLLTGLLVVLASVPASAQFEGLRGRVSIHVNGGFQTSTDTVQRVFTFRAYAEEARFEEDHETQNGGLLDLGGSLQVWEQLGIGASYSQIIKADSTVLTGTVPNPVLVNTPRTIAPQMLSLAHQERTTHLYAAWVVPVDERVDVTIFGGPSFFSLTQGVVTGVAIRETSGPPWPTVAIDAVSSGEFKKNGFGLHVGADVRYMITPTFGLGGFLRFAAGSIDIPSSDGDRPLNVGGLQTGGGVRIRF